MLAEPPVAWHWEATAAHRTLVERDAGGARLLRESGPLIGLRLTARPHWAAARVEFSAALAHGRLDYEGRTQNGAPLGTRSRHGEGELGLRWRPVQPFAWGEPSLSFDVSRLERRIAATPTTGALTETSTVWLPGVAWTTPSWAMTPGVAVSFHARWRASTHHRLDVDYGGVFDRSVIRGGRRDEVTLRANAALPGGWALALEGHHVRQSPSAGADLLRAGALAGTVRQPRLSIGDVALKLSREF